MALSLILTGVALFLAIGGFAVARSGAPHATIRVYAASGTLSAILLLPALAHLLFAPLARGRGLRGWGLPLMFVLAGLVMALCGWPWAGTAAAAYGAFGLLEAHMPRGAMKWLSQGASFAVMAAVLVVLSGHWMPLGPGAGLTRSR